MQDEDYDKKTSQSNFHINKFQLQHDFRYNMTINQM